MRNRQSSVPTTAGTATISYRRPARNNERRNSESETNAPGGSGGGARLGCPRATSVNRAATFCEPVRTLPGAIRSRRRADHSAPIHDAATVSVLFTVD